MLRQIAVQGIAVFTALCLASCTSMRPVPSGEPKTVQQSVKVGDEVSVVAANGKTYLLLLTAVDNEKIVGTGDNKKVSIRYSQIVSMEVRKVSAARTAGLAGGVLVTLYAVASIAAFYAFRAFGKAFENDDE